MALLLKGKPVADKLAGKVKSSLENLKENGVTPALAIIRVGNKPDDLAYERGAAKRCESMGVAARNYALPGDAGEDAVFGAVSEACRDSRIHGVLLLRPLPYHVNDRTARAKLTPEKDVDGITDASMAGVFMGTGNGFSPCTARACIEILDHYGISIPGKRVAVVGRSLVVGRPVAMMLTRRDATVTICHSKTENLAEITRSADIVVVAAGRAESFGREYFSEGQVILDVGIHAGKDGKLCGDVKFSEAEPLAAAITPVPGGAGAVTPSVLVVHVIKAAERILGDRLKF
ncbi:MAG: bifunctional 5,10-methylenetetrahydrofolate dehydrogenase/5,10-methenyltetrahydrofolate cyclohydrolase [Clostridiales Family XIII bacterium]|jgi:methylenetetrahydrofolate dehydrogenase (NADP+)/methenyltetrahydrofolate cyclohydrolase|nr:bifunctional 5,10-methylenetetrahydrofolate dehydrogenase/5,10-methenyltetrahydrofolate cyclohydrolase [Clostridiales Family XIII bacterium]